MSMFDYDARPVTSPAADTVPFPVTWRMTPLTRTSPLTLVLFSRTSDLGPSYLVQLEIRARQAIPDRGPAVGMRHDATRRPVRLRDAT